MDYNVFFVVGDSSVSLYLLIPQHGYLIIIIIIIESNLAAFQRAWITDQALLIHRSADRLLTTVELQLSYAGCLELRLS